jgi:hypothetical protein
MRLIVAFHSYRSSSALQTTSEANENRLVKSEWGLMHSQLNTNNHTKHVSNIIASKDWSL